MKCKNCNQEITDDSNFCEHCGVPIKQPWGQYVFFALYLFYLILVPFRFGFLFCALIAITTGSLLYRQSRLLRLFFIITLIMFGSIIVFLLFWGYIWGISFYFLNAIGDAISSCPG